MTYVFCADWTHTATHYEAWTRMGLGKPLTCLPVHAQPRTLIVGGVGKQGTQLKHRTVPALLLIRPKEQPAPPLHKCTKNSLKPDHSPKTNKQVKRRLRSRAAAFYKPGDTGIYPALFSEESIASTIKSGEMTRENADF
jgi:hypothetical protein